MDSAQYKVIYSNFPAVTAIDEEKKYGCDTMSRIKNQHVVVAIVTRVGLRLLNLHTMSFSNYCFIGNLIFYRHQHTYIHCLSPDLFSIFCWYG